MTSPSFARLDDLTDLNNSISLCQEAVDLTPDGNLDDLEDIHKAISAQEAAVRLAPHEDPNKPVCLINLGNLLFRRFERLGEPTDLDNAILAQEEAMEIIPNNHPNRLIWLFDLIRYLLLRFERLGDPEDLTRSILLSEETLVSPGPPQAPYSVLHLIVHILTIGECSVRTFHQLLTLIQSLSHIPDAQDVIAQELQAKAQDCGQNVLTDLNQLLVSLQNSDQDILSSPPMSRFSSPSSDQTKLLRILTTLDRMYGPRSEGPFTDETHKGGDADKVADIYESFQFTPLWWRLGDCLAIIEAQPDMEHVSAVWLPLIETLMVMCKNARSRATVAALAKSIVESDSPRSPTVAGESIEDLFVTFTNTHRKILNIMLRNNPSLISGSFSLLVHYPHVLDFDNKQDYFTHRLHRRPASREDYGTLWLNVRRPRVFEDSFQYLQRKTGDQIKYGKLSVRFYNEEDTDTGDATREWLQCLARQIFDPNFALFLPCGAVDRLTYEPNKNSFVHPQHLSFFRFVGRVIGKAVYDGQLIDAYFGRSLYRQLLGKPIDYRDMEWIDPQYCKSLCWILENDPTPLELTFSVEAEEFGRQRIVPLKPRGESIPVTQENRREFVRLLSNFRLYSSIGGQIKNLVAGFQEIIPKDLVTIFNEQELKWLISGTPSDTNIDEWKTTIEDNENIGLDVPENANTMET